MSEITDGITGVDSEEVVTSATQAAQGFITSASASTLAAGLLTEFLTSASLSVAFAPRLKTVRPVTGDIELSLGDVNTYIRITGTSASASAQTLITVPTNGSVAFPVGSQITVHQVGVGQMLITSAGVTAAITFNSPQTNQLIGADSTVILTKVDTDEWDLFGDLAST